MNQKLHEIFMFFDREGGVGSIFPATDVTVVSLDDDNVSNDEDDDGGEQKLFLWTPGKSRLVSRKADVFEQSFVLWHNS